MLLPSLCAKQNALMAFPPVTLQNVWQKANYSRYFCLLRLQCFDHFQWSNLVFTSISLQCLVLSRRTCCILKSVERVRMFCKHTEKLWKSFCSSQINATCTNNKITLAKSCLTYIEYIFGTRRRWLPRLLAYIWFPRGGSSHNLSRLFHTEVLVGLLEAFKVEKHFFKSYRSWKQLQLFFVKTIWMLTSTKYSLTLLIYCQGWERS